ncbi:hypothetical protein [Frigoriflavimonas asaccharolytica]|uniref:Uncharacterized protein n=1 Tax=Frigoriflavimonas asaccharolytica TaxID=2735899 RepID=A0A8J8K736_9FLAO|nr:hypothetical protein [Frigoriflavimonas asaccharolytica]NRS91593.1 hypothetical protein [Frigoriflavimonas asaccharolytica]
MDTENIPYLKVLQKFINIYLFGSIVKPKYSKNQEIQLNNDIINLLKYENLELEEDVKVYIAQKYMENSIIKFKKLLNEKDITNLMLCYVNSHFRTHIQSILILKKAANPGKELKFGDDLYIFQECLSKSENFAKEIQIYIYIQFCNIMKDIPQDVNTITKQQYLHIVNEYATQYDEIKTMGNFENSILNLHNEK